jgi:hypothetical protein
MQPQRIKGGGVHLYETVIYKGQEVARFEIGAMKADKKMCEYLKITKEELYEMNTNMLRKYYDETYFYSWGSTIW